jgi:hypothetical protein
MGCEGGTGTQCASCCPRRAGCELHDLFRRAAVLGVDPGCYCAYRFERCCEATRAACQPHRPCTPAPGGVAAEQR